MTEVVTTEVTSGSTITDLPIITKGLMTTALGLLGVFLVLGIFFGTIKLMQRIKTKDEEN
jgi:hypothetical protein